MSNTTAYTIKELMKLEVVYEWLIHKFLMVGDIFMIKAQKKVGKGVLAQQMAFALASGEPFLGCFKVKRPCKVAYLSGEGFIGNWRDRIVNMKKLYPLIDENLIFIDCVKEKLHTDMGAAKMLANLKKLQIDFDVLIFDPLYKLASGADYNDNTIMGEFFNNIEMLVKAFNASAIIVHHDSEKEYRDNRGFKHSSASVKNAMGASSILWAVTHYATLTTYKNANRKKIHKLEFGECRSDDYLEDIEFQMITPEEDATGRLGYVLDGDETNANYHIIKEYIKEKGKISSYKIHKTLQMSANTFYKHIHRLEDHGIVFEEKDEYGKTHYYYKGEQHV